jgi:hypothetical protein
MKIAEVTDYYIYQNTIWPIKQKIINPIYAAIPNCLFPDKVSLFKRDNAPWFTSGNILTLHIENVKLEMIALVSSNSNEVLEMISHYQELANQWKEKQEKDSVVNKLNRLYKEE